MSISKQLGIFEKYASYDAITPAHRAWITLKARQQGRDPMYVHAGIKAEFTKRKGK